MCGSLVDIQYTTAEIRRGKKIARKKKKPQEGNTMSASAMRGGHKNASNMKAIHTRDSSDSDARRLICLL